MNPPPPTAAKPEILEHFLLGVRTLLDLKITEANNALNDMKPDLHVATQRLLERARLFKALDPLGNQLGLFGKTVGNINGINLSPAHQTLLIEYFLAHESRQIQSSIQLAKAFVETGASNDPNVAALAAL